jgi:hypothetical protein
MEFTLPELFSVHCINYREPLLWVTIGATGLLNFVLGLGAVRLALSVRDPCEGSSTSVHFSSSLSHWRPLFPSQ